MPAVQYFRPRRPGPEARLEDAVAMFAPQLVAAPELAWMGGSLQVGAGFPDLLVANVDPGVRQVPQTIALDSNLLAFMHAAGASVPVDDLARFAGRSAPHIHDRLAVLAAAEVVEGGPGHYGLFPSWRAILAEVIAIEVKVANWRRAAAQAKRNRLFAHASYVALPCQLAQRVCDNPAILADQLGVLGVHSDGTVTVLRDSRRLSPRLWNYYYWIALKAAESIGGTSHGLPRVHCPGAGTVS